MLNNCVWKGTLKYKFYIKGRKMTNESLYNWIAGKKLSLAISVIKSAFIDVFSLGNVNQSNGK